VFPGGCGIVLTLPPAMIFLNDNVLLEEKLSRDHIKHRLLGHWDTCLGLVPHIQSFCPASGLKIRKEHFPPHTSETMLGSSSSSQALVSLEASQGTQNHMTFIQYFF
jgi:hypothetical protein